MYFGEIWNFHNFKCSNISAFISFHNEKNYIFGISITCRFQKKYFQPPLNFFIFHHPLRRLFRWLSDTYMKKKLYICDQHPLRVSLNFFQKFFFQSPSPLKKTVEQSKGTADGRNEAGKNQWNLSWLEGWTAWNMYGRLEAITDGRIDRNEHIRTNGTQHGRKDGWQEACAEEQTYGDARIIFALRWLLFF